jgi:hypothetical protein
MSKWMGGNIIHSNFTILLDRDREPVLERNAKNPNLRHPELVSG